MAKPENVKSIVIAHDDDNYFTHAHLEIDAYIISTVVTDGLELKAVSTMLMVWYAVQNQKLKLYLEEK